MSQLATHGEGNMRAGSLLQSSSYSYQPVRSSRSDLISRLLVISTGDESWRPWTLWSITHLGLAAVMLAIIAFLQVLRAVNDTRGGLTFTNYNSDFPPATQFVYFYLPTILAVLIGLAWNWIDLDVKRLEPYLQMSKEGGASADDSLLLAYPFDYILFAPYKALRRRHWPVAIVGTITILFFWAITPLQSTIFSRGRVMRTETLDAFETASLDTLRLNASSLESGFLQTAWLNLWYNASLPAFATPNGTIIPFAYSSGEQIFMSNATLQINGTFVYSTLDCNTYPLVDSWGASQRPGCKGTAYSKPWSLFYYGHASAEWTDYYLTESGCPSQQFPHTFFAAWAGGEPVPGTQPDLANQYAGVPTGAGLCQPSYWTRPTKALLRRDDRSVLSYELYGEPRLLLQSDFNSTVYEYLTTVGMTPFLGPPTDAPNSKGIRQFARINQLGIGSDAYLQLLSGIAVAMSPDPKQLLSNSTYFSALSRANSFTFALAANSLFARSASRQRAIPCQVIGSVRAVVMNDLQLVIFQSIIGLVAAMILLLALVSLGRPNKLVRNPDCLAVVAQMIPRRKRNEPTAVKKEPGPAMFSLERSPDASRVHFSREIHLASSLAESDAEPTDHVFEPRRPFYMARAIGLVFVVILSAMIAVLLVLQVKSGRENGLPTIDTSNLGRTIVLNYLPIMFTTLLAPFWLLLNRTLCILQPFEELRSLDAKPRRSIFARYTSLPPQLVFFRALTARHYLLALVCITAFSCNVLSVSMGALFVLGDVTFPHVVPLRPSLANTFSSKPTISDAANTNAQLDNFFAPSYMDPLYVVDEYLTTNATDNVSASLTPTAWMMDGTFFVPLPYDDALKFPNASEVTVNTTGFTVKPQCRALTTSAVAMNMSESYALVFTASRPQSIYNVSFEVDYTPAFPDPACSAATRMTTPLSSEYSTQKGLYFINSSAGPEALEFITKLYPGGSNASSCTYTIFGGFLRDVRVTPSIDYSATVQRPFGAQNYTSARFFICESTLTAAQYEIKTDLAGRVRSSRQIAPDTTDVAAAYCHGNSSMVREIVRTATEWTFGPGLFVGEPLKTHNVTAGVQWFVYMMSRMPRMRSIVDPSKPLPTAEELASLAERTISLLGATTMALNRNTIFDRAGASAAAAAAAAPAANSVDAIVSVPTTRIFMNPVLLFLTVGLLGAHLLVAIVFYYRTPRKLLQEMPTNIAAQVALFKGSSLLDADGTSFDRSAKLGYGHFRGTDGRVRTGIDFGEQVSHVRLIR